MITPEVVTEIRAASDRVDAAFQAYRDAKSALEGLVRDRLGAGSVSEAARMLREHARAEASAQREAERASRVDGRRRNRVHLEGGPPTEVEIAALPSKQRAVMELRAAGVRQTDIAARLGISAGAASMRRADAFAKIRQWRRNGGPPTEPPISVDEIVGMMPTPAVPRAQAQPPAPANDAEAIPGPIRARDLVEYDRPRVRRDCLPGGMNEQRPCPFVACRHHLLADVAKSGALLLARGTDDPSELTETCSLDVAERGPNRLEDVGELFGVVRERIRQIEERGLAKVRKRARIAELDAGDVVGAREHHLAEAAS